MRFAFLLAILAVTLPAQQRSRKAHEHGAAKINIAFESTKGAPKGVIEFEAPAESVVGFEHEAKSAADKANQAAALNTLKARFGEMVVIPGCKITPKSAKVEVEHHDAKTKGAKHEEHSEVHAEFDVQCAKPLAGTVISFGIAKVFPKIHDTDVALIAGEQQSSVEVKTGKETLRIAK
ncbi:MAG: DUF2796 domain-containing protein [Acidobacteria bacterium]|nr:DUF2796 domain-containing protein [Acidobacteriota bacterium]